MVSWSKWELISSVDVVVGLFCAGLGRTMRDDDLPEEEEEEEEEQL